METVKETLKKCGALLKGHFKLTSGRHSDQYLEKAEICVDPIITGDFCWEMAQGVVSQFKAFDRNRVEVVVGLAPIGAVLANRVAEYLEEFYQEKVISVFTEKGDPSTSSGQVKGKMVFKRGYAKYISGKRVLIVDDVLTTGGSVERVKKETERLRGEVLGVAVICQRGEIRSEELSGTPILSLAQLMMEDWLPEECPLCAKNVPLQDLKSR